MKKLCKLGHNDLNHADPHNTEVKRIAVIERLTDDPEPALAKNKVPNKIFCKCPVWIACKIS